MPLKDELRQRLDALSPVLQRIAKYVLDHPNEVVTHSMRAVAMHAEAPPSALVRFAQQLGHDGWPQFKQALADDMGLGSEEAYGARARSLLDRADDRGLADEIFAVHHANLDATRQQSADSMERVAEMLRRADAVHAAGFRACFPVAFSFVYVYRLLRNSVHLLDGQGGSLEMQLRGADAGDAVVVVSFAPYSREALQVADAAKSAGCTLIALTDSLASPISLRADATLLFSTRSPSFFPSVTPAMALVEALIELIASQSGPDAVARIDAAEAQLFESGAYAGRTRRANRRPAGGRA